MCSELERRGYTLDEMTRAMGMRLDGIRLPRPELELAPADWSEHLRIAGVPARLLSDLDTAAFHVLVARLCGESVATAIAFDFGTDCGIYNVGTLDWARRRGLGTALTHCTCTMRSPADAGRRACRRPRSPSASMPRWGSATSDGSSNSRRRSPQRASRGHRSRIDGPARTQADQRRSWSLT